MRTVVGRSQCVTWRNAYGDIAGWATTSTKAKAVTERAERALRKTPVMLDAALRVSATLGDKIPEIGSTGPEG